MLFNKSSFVTVVLILNENLGIYANPGKNDEINTKREISPINNDNTCTSAKCINESAYYLYNMDLKVDPCNNFYSFACGGFLKKSSIPEGEFTITQYGILNKKIEDDLINELKSGPQPNDLEAFKIIKNFYVNCIDEARIEKEGSTPILELLEKLGGWPVLKGDKWKEDNYSWENVVSLISNIGLWPDFPCRVDVDYDFYVKKYMIAVRGPIIEVDDSYNMTDDNSKHFINFMTDIAILLGAKNETASIDMRDLLKFELELFNTVYSTEENYSTEISIKEWTKENPDISWLSLLNKIFNPSNVTITEDDSMIIDNARYVSKLMKLLNHTPKRTMANYQLWRILYYYIIKFTPKAFRDKYEHFKELISEKDQSFPRENECLNYLQQHSPVALNSLYIQKFVNKSGHSELLHILGNVKNETKKYIGNLQWVDDDLRKIALEKVEKLHAFVGYPAELLNNTKVEDFYKGSSANSKSALHSYINIAKAEKNFPLRKLRYARREHDWVKNVNVAKVRANYDIDNHRINVLAGISQSPFFDLDRPNYLNYGGLGFVMGHEIIHGIDTSHVRNYHKIVFKNSTIEEYKKRSACIMDQFSNYTISEVYGNVDGERTLKENIADAGGLKLGYYAYNSWVKHTNASELQLPGLNYTPHQMYWISIASSLCSKIKDVSLPKYLRADNHSPVEARINVGFSNVDEFAKDFNCPLGSKMNPIHKCVVW